MSLTIPVRQGDSEVVLLSVGDIGRAFGVTAGAVCLWSSRYPSFPRPITTNPRYWRLDDVEGWARTASVLGHTFDRSVARHE